MRKPVVLVWVALFITILSGCLVSKTPHGDVNMAAGEKMTFSVKVYPSARSFTWTLDGEALSNAGCSYAYTAQNGGHVLTVQAKHALGTDTQTWNIQVASPIASTKYGLLEGVNEDNVVVFKGIPYAKAPVGELRFHSPEETDSWEGVRSAKAFGSGCAQMPIMSILGDIALGDTEGECEDCLFLNIWTPSLEPKKRPVMFFLHGGGGLYGSGSQAFYRGNLLCEKGDVVVVVINYRMGVFGNLTHPDLKDEYGHVGNWGLLDTIAALKWVKGNIAAFGGDPDNVTLFGESAGAWAVCALLVSPETKVDGTRLFKRAIAESPAIEMRTMEEAITDANNISRRAGCANGDFECLRNRSFHQIRLADDMFSEILPPLLLPLFSEHAELRRFIDWNVIPAIDGVVIPKTPTEAIKAGWTNDVPLIIGTNEEEMDIIACALEAVLPHDKIMDYISAFVPGYQPDGTEKAEVMYSAYLKALEEAGLSYPKLRVFGNIFSDYNFRIKAIKYAQMHKAAGGDAYMYQFVFPLMLDQSFHATELPYVFGQLKFPGLMGYIFDYNAYPAAVRLKNVMQDAWLAFAKTGIPDISTDEVILAWPQYDSTSRKTMILGKDTKVEAAPKESRRAVWDEVHAAFYGFD